jgi:hypothetical protein
VPCGVIQTGRRLWRVENMKNETFQGNPLFPCGRLSRRRFLHQVGGGFVGASIGALLAAEGKLASSPQPHFPARARSVIYLFMCGGVSHIDTFDPKDNRLAGTMMDAVGFGDNLAQMRRPVIPCHRTFTPYGQSGIPVSDWFPNVGSVIDEIAVVRSMYCHESNHFPAVIETATGHRGRVFDHPSLGGWVSYALGTENQNLPAFVNLGRPTSPVQLTGGYLGGEYAATPFESGATPVADLNPPDHLNRAERDARMQALSQLNRQFRRDYETDRSIRARIKAYDLAARMQVAAPEVVDFSGEPDHVRDLYGIGRDATDKFGRQMLLARRLVENGVRFIQVCHSGGGNGGWDSHDDMKSHEPLCRSVDRPIAGLLRDLKQRGLLDSTLVVWTSEFGRTPWSQNTTGRDHNPKGFSSWLAGGGVRGGVVHGSTDEVGYQAVEGRQYIADLQATILRQMGLDHDLMEVEVNGQPVRLVEKVARPIDAIL